MVRDRKKAERRGKRAEAIARLLLRLKGYRILAHRFKSPAGEIDLIAKRGHHVAVVEVKARKNITEAVESISYKQRKRIERAAADWLSRQKKQNISLRFDVIAIAPGHFPHHMIDAWRPER